MNEKLLKQKYRHYELFIINIFEQRRKAGKLSASHDVDHVCVVAQGAITYNNKYGSDWLMDECYVAGLLHDIAREKKECGVHHSLLGMQLIQNSFLRDWLIQDFGFQGYRRVLLAVGMHSLPFNKVWSCFSDQPELNAVERLSSLLRTKELNLITSGDLDGLGLTRWDKEVVLAVLFGDKIKEQRGCRIVERRSKWCRELLANDEEVRAFITRIARPMDRIDMLSLIFIGESLMRLYVRNRFDLYPSEIQALVREDYLYELTFIYAIAMHVADFFKCDVKDLPYFYLRFGYPRFVGTDELEQHIREDMVLCDEFLASHGESLGLKDVIDDTLEILATTPVLRQDCMRSCFGKELSKRLLSKNKKEKSCLSF